MFWIFILIWIVEEMSTELKNMNKSLSDRINKFNDETDWELFRNEDERFR